MEHKLFSELVIDSVNKVFTPEEQEFIVKGGVYLKNFEGDLEGALDNLKTTLPKSFKEPVKKILVSKHQLEEMNDTHPFWNKIVGRDEEYMKTCFLGTYPETVATEVVISEINGKVNPHSLLKCFENPATELLEHAVTPAQAIELINRLQSYKKDEYVDLIFFVTGYAESKRDREGDGIQNPQPGVLVISYTFWKVQPGNETPRIHDGKIMGTIRTDSGGSNWRIMDELKNPIVVLKKSLSDRNPLRMYI